MVKPDDWQTWTGLSNLSAIGATVKVNTTRGEQLRPAFLVVQELVSKTPMNLHFGLKQTPFNRLKFYSKVAPA